MARSHISIVKRVTEIAVLLRNATTANSAAFIGLCLGEAGKLSRVLNQVMCPSMHPDLAPGAPGQMSVKELLEVRQGLGLMGSSRQFAVIGPWGDVPAASFYVGLLGHKWPVLLFQEFCC